MSNLHSLCCPSVAANAQIQGRLSMSAVWGKGGCCFPLSHLDRLCRGLMSYLPDHCCRDLRCNDFPLFRWTSDWLCPGLCFCGTSEPPDLQFVLLSPVLDSQQPWLYVSAFLMSDQSRLPNHTVTGKTPREAAWSLLIFCPSVWDTLQDLPQRVNLCVSTKVGSQLLYLPCMIEGDLIK